VAEGAPGLRFHTLTRGQDRTPVYFASSLYRGDRYEIELSQTRSSGSPADSRR
jgi:DNA-binding GntR family transcriptional regulator